MIPQPGEIWTDGYTYMFIKKVYIGNNIDLKTNEIFKETCIDISLIGRDAEDGLLYLSSFAKCGLRKHIHDNNL